MKRPDYPCTLTTNKAEAVRAAFDAPAPVEGAFYQVAADHQSVTVFAKDSEAMHRALRALGVDRSLNM